MGREIRRVPAGWQHPVDHAGRYKPMYDQAYADAAAEWWRNALLWSKGEHPDQLGNDVTKKYLYYWEWSGNPPDEEYYRPAFEGEPTHYQIYETVSEGTPVSPVFETKDELAAWLVTEGYSTRAAAAFAKDGWAPSMAFCGGHIYKNIEAAELSKSADAEALRMDKGE